MPGQRDSIDGFYFRDLHPLALLGTASDRYAGWLGQIYTRGRYEGAIRKRQKTVGGKSFEEEVLPVESVAEYFEHFGVLELDYTFYSTLLDEEGRRSGNYKVIESYCRHLKAEDKLILKVPQLVFAQKIRRGGSYSNNESYLDATVFTDRFYKPALELLGDRIQAFIFEQEYQRKDERVPAQSLSASLEEFFSKIPKDDRYHIELRTGSYLSRPVMDFLERWGIGQVLSHWTWLPTLTEQFAFAGWRFLNRGRTVVLRLMTPRGMRYEDAYAKASPFNRLIEGMLDPKMVQDTVFIMKQAIKEGVVSNVIINNRAGGNAPIIAQLIARRFLSSSS